MVSLFLKFDQNCGVGGPLLRAANYCLVTTVAGERKVNSLARERRANLRADAVVVGVADADANADQFH